MTQAPTDRVHKAMRASTTYSAGELADLTGLGVDTVRFILSGLVRRGLAFKSGEGKHRRYSTKQSNFDFPGTK